MLKTYWNLEEKERAALTREEVEKFLDAELMTKGVLKVLALRLDPEPEIVEPAATTYYQVGSVAFSTAKAAEDFIKLAPISIDTKYIGGGWRTSVSVASPIVGSPTELRVVSPSEYADRRNDLEKRETIRVSNEKAREEHAKASKAQDSVLSGVWEDWARCREVDAGHRRVVSTFREYVAVAGDELTAAKFLAKAFTVAQIAEAAKWCGVAILIDAEFDEVKPAPAPQSTEAVF